MEAVMMGLAVNFCKAVSEVLDGKLEGDAAQRKWLGCSIDEVVRSHVAVFGAEKARREKVVLDWKRFWMEEVEARIEKRKA